MPIKGKTQSEKIHNEAKHLKEKKVHGKKPWGHLSWRDLHGIAKQIVTGKGKKR